MKQSILLFLLIGLTLLIIPTTQENKNIVPKTKEKEEIGLLEISKINLKEKLYKIDSPKNTIEEHVSILKESTTPDKENSLLILAAHSGTGKIAYFEELDQLNINDEITIFYQKKKYQYIVKEKWEEKKNGYIHIKKESKKQLVLTTCSPKRKNYQLIVNCIEKESNN